MECRELLLSIHIKSRLNGYLTDSYVVFDSAKHNYLNLYLVICISLH